MALLGNLVVRLGLDSAEFSAGLNNATKQLNTAGLAMSRLGSDLTKSVTVPIALAAGAVVKFGSDFEDAFTGVRKTVNATEPEFQKLRKGFRDLALEIPLAVEELAGIGEAAGQLGIETENILSFTRVMADLGVTTNLSAEQAATALARFANITGLSQTQFDRLGSTIVELGNNFATTEAEIVEFGLRLAGAGSQIGLTEAEILGFATALSSVGLEAQAGGTAFSRVFLEIQKQAATGGEKLALFAKIAGQSTAAFRESFQRDAAGAITDFIEGLGGMNAQAGETVLALEALGITEIRLRDALLRSAGAGDLLRESLQTGTRAFEENVALTKEAELRYKTFSSQLVLVKNALKDIGIELFDSLRPVLIDSVIPGIKLAVSVLRKAVEAFSALPQPVKTLTVAFFALFAAIGPILIVGSKLIFTFKNVLVLLGQAAPALAGTAAASKAAGAGAAAAAGKVGLLGGAFSGLGGILKVVVAALTGPVGIVVALAAAVVGIVLFKDEIADAIIALTDWIGLTNSSNKILRETQKASVEASAGFKNVAHSIGIGVAGLKTLTAENSLAIDALSLNRAAVDKLKQAMVEGKFTVAEYQGELQRLIRLETEKKIAEIHREFAEARQEFAAGKITLEELGEIVGRNNDLYAKWVDRIQDVKRANSEAIAQARKDLSFYQKFLLDIAKNAEDQFGDIDPQFAERMRRRTLGMIDPSGLAGATEEQVAANLQRLSEAAREAAESGRVVGAVFADAGKSVADAGAASESAAPKVTALGVETGKAADSTQQLVDSVNASLTPVANLATELGLLASKGFTPAQLAAAGYADKAAVAVAEQMRINEAIGVTDAALPPLIAKLLELAEASKAAADWTALASQGIQSLGIEAAKVPATLENIIGPMTELGSLTVKNADQFETFSKGALAGRQALREMEAQLRATEQKVRDFTDAKLTDVQILHKMGSEISSAAELAKVLGVELDETTAALFRQIKAAEQSAKFSKQWQDAWSTAVGNIVSRFTKGVTDMIFEGKRMSFDLKDIFRDLAKSLLEILIGQLFSPLFKFVNQLGAQIGDWVGGLLGIPTSGATAGAGGGGGGLGGFAGGKPTSFLAGLGAAGLGFGGSLGGGKLGEKIGGSVGAQVGSIGGGLAGMFLASKLGLFGAGAAATGGAVAGGAAAGGAGAAAGAGAGTAGGGLGLGTMGASLAGAVKSAAVFLATNPIGWAILGGIGVFAAFKLARKSPEEKISSELGRDFAGISAGKGDVKQIIASLGINAKQSEGIRKEISTLIALQQGFGAGATAQTQQAVLSALSRFQVSAAVGGKALAAGVKGQQIGQDIIFDLSAAVKQAFAGVTGPLIEQLSLILGGSQRFAQALPNFADIIASLIGPGSQAQAAADQFAKAGEKAQEASSKTLEGLQAVGAIAETFPGFAERVKDQVQEALRPPEAPEGGRFSPDRLIPDGAVTGIMSQDLIARIREQVAAALGGSSGQERFGFEGAVASFMPPSMLDSLREQITAALDLNVQAAEGFAATSEAAVQAGSVSENFLASMGSGLESVSAKALDGVDGMIGGFDRFFHFIDERLAALENRSAIEPQASAATGNGKTVTVQIFGGDRKEVLKTVQQAMSTNEDGFGENFIYDFKRQEGGF